MCRWILDQDRFVDDVLYEKQRVEKEKGQNSKL